MSDFVDVVETDDGGQDVHEQYPEIAADVPFVVMLRASAECVLERAGGRLLRMAAGEEQEIDADEISRLYGSSGFEMCVMHGGAVLVDWTDDLDAVARAARGEE